MTPEEYQEFHNNVVLRDATVNRMLKEKCEPEKIIAILCDQKKALIGRVLELEAIAPRKIVLPDGTAMVWHCPDEHVKPR